MSISAMGSLPGMTLCCAAQEGSHLHTRWSSSRHPRPPPQLPRGRTAPAAAQAPRRPAAGWTPEPPALCSTHRLHAHSLTSQPVPTILNACLPSMRSGMHTYVAATIASHSRVPRAKLKDADRKCQGLFLTRGARLLVRACLISSQPCPQSTCGSGPRRSRCGACPCQRRLPSPDSPAGPAASAAPIFGILLMRLQSVNADFPCPGVQTVAACSARHLQNLKLIE